MLRMTRLTDYGFVLLTHIARHPERLTRNAPELAAAARLPLPTVSKILKILAREGLREFYDPYDGRGMGAQDFAWSALALELLDPSNANVGIPM